MPTKPAPTIGDRIKAARLAANMTQLALAHALGRTGSNAGAYISHVESGGYLPRIDTLQRIAAALGVPLEKLLSRK